MARVLGYGGVANTNGLRDFSGKAEAETGVDDMSGFHPRFGFLRLGFRSIILFFSLLS